MKYKLVSGTQDFLPYESKQLNHIEDKIRNVATLFNYGEVRTPIFEYTELFSRGIGLETDIVSKEMYSFVDSGEKSLTLRPENTASIVRMVIEKNLIRENPQYKLFYLGPMFRRERPQKGRFRQFHQYGFEAIGPKSAEIDVEMILVALTILKSFGLDDLKLQINSIGDKTSRREFVKALKLYVKPRLDKYCNDCKKRFLTNPLRILDCKIDIKLNLSAPKICDYLDSVSKVHFEKVKKSLNKLSVKYDVNHLLVRGLDYYTDTVFEINSDQIGSQSALIGGGRYDLLFEELGGKETAAIGFAGGLERLIMTLEANQYKFPFIPIMLFIVTMDEESRIKSSQILQELRLNGISTDMDYLGRSLKAQMKYANKIKCKYSVVIGEIELKTGSVKLKQMETGYQREVKLDQLKTILLE